MEKSKLFVAGLLNSNFFEAYYIIDLEKKETKEILVDNTKEQEHLVKMIERQFPKGKLPYGAQKTEQFLPYLINPHSCYKVGDRMLSFMLQAPYFREINVNSLETRAITYKDPTDTIFSASSIGNRDDNLIYLSVNSSDERADIYNGKKTEMGFDYLEYDVERRRFQEQKHIEKGLIDNMHQVGYSKERFLVSLDMNISVNLDVSDMPGLDNEAVRIEYNNADFPKGKIFLWDMQKEKSLIMEPPLYTPAHVEFDRDDQSVFYVSCHNMSKFKGSMVLHGPGMIVKYRYTDGIVVNLGCFTDSEFNRITTHKIFYYNEKPFLAVTGYPNYLYIIDAETMVLANKIKLFEAEPSVLYQDGLFPCIGNRKAPLYLQVNAEGTEVYLVNSDTCFSVLWLESSVSSFKYTENNFAVSAHFEIF
ncbi:hypothetical protein ABFV83_17220 [Lacrimispora sp. BS-2]|uniref:Uncharacterized protein n=1 Tax=Lacrimispora sp. BS-2 TaxID=3151850 RepID=A0AAU7PMN3_9FIRM